MVNPAGTVRRVAFFCLKRWIRLRHPAVRSITPEQLQRILAGEQRDDWLILDARSPAEFACSHLPGAALIEAPGRIAGMGSMAALARDRPIVVCCSVGVRSAARVEDLQRAGFTRAVNLDGGLFQWAREGRSLVRQGEPTLLVHPYGLGWGWLLPAHSRGTEGC
jgi:rhodanese-related sulfurtransferase